MSESEDEHERERQRRRAERKKRKAARAALADQQSHDEDSSPNHPEQRSGASTSHAPDGASRQIGNRPQRSQVDIGKPTPGWWTAFKRWTFWRYLLRGLPYAMAAGQVALMICIGVSGSTTVPVEYRWYLCRVGGYRIGGLGYCDDLNGVSVQSIFYNIKHGSTSTWGDTRILNALLLMTLLGAMLALASYTLLLVRVLGQGKWVGAECFSCCSLSCSRCYSEEKGKKKILEDWWFERTMFLVLVWTLGVGGLIMAWISNADAEGLQGDAMLTAVMIMSGAWLPLYWIYNSGGDGFQREPRIRKRRKVVRGAQSV